MTTKALAISIVIPVYNEEHHITDCLDAIAKQTVMPLEVIVVDNNCTDQTVALAKRYPFVRIIKEKKQGLTYSRNAAAAAAKGDIIAKIDADSFLFPDWVERLTRDYADPSVTGVVGVAYANYLPRITRFRSQFWPRVYFWNVHSFFGTTTMWGANMSFRRSMWQKIKSDVCNDPRQVHEDEDVSLLIASRGGKIIKDNKLLINTNKQSYHYFPKFVHYMHLAHLTKQYHQRKGSFDTGLMPRLNFWKTLPGMLFSLLAGIPFIIVSALFWPLDAYMIRQRRRTGGKPWLD